MSEAKYPPSSSSWLSAGVGLIFSQVEDAMTGVNRFLDQSKETFEELQARGEKIDEKLKQSRQSTSIFTMAKDFAPNIPSFSFLPCQKSAQKRTQQLDDLSSKVDVLIEQVALLAAKRAAKKVTEKQSETKTASTTRRKRTTTKSAAENAKAPVAKAPVTRKRATPAKPKTATSTKAKPATTRATSTKKSVEKPDSAEE